MTRNFNFHSHCRRFLGILALMLGWVFTQLQAQNCANDTIPPTAVCVEQLVVAVGADNASDCYGPAGPNNTPPAIQGGGVVWAYANAFNDGSYDNCNGVHITMRRQAPYSNAVLNLNAVRGTVPCNDPFPTFPSEFERAISEQDSIKFYCGEVGTSQTVVMRAYQVDANGNFMLHNGNYIFSECLVTVSVTDKTKPVVQAPADVTVSCEAFDPSLLAYGTATANDNCCIDHITETRNYSLFDTLCNKGTITRVFQAFDCSGNSSTLGIVSAMQTIVVNYEQDYYIKFPNDVVTTVFNAIGDYGQPSFYGEDCELMGVSYEDQFFPDPNNNQIRLERTWTVINWCTYDPNLLTISVPNPNPNGTLNHPANLPGPVVSAAGTQAPWAPTISKIFPSDPTPTNFSSFWQADANGYRYMQTITLLDTTFASLEGRIFRDTSASCAYEAGEPLMPGWTVKVKGLVTGLEYQSTSDANGVYHVAVLVTDTTVEVSLASAVNFAPNCTNVFTVQTPSGQVAEQDIAVELVEECPILSVDLGAPVLRRCFSDNYYIANGCNLSGSTIEDARVEVALDSYLSYTGSSIPGTALPDNTYSFEIGDLAPGECRSFKVYFGIDCAAPLGATHCSTASIKPDTLCEWLGPNLRVVGQCDGDSVRFVLSNTGLSDMTQAVDFVVVEDVVMRQQGNVQLNMGQSQSFALPANGSTWRLQAGQVPGFPWDGPIAAVVEGCGGLNTTGLVTLFPINNANPFQTTDCQQNRGSFDPNDKSAVPQGYGSEHLIEKNTDLDYTIRFQNTGTDTAFTVVVLDTLSQYLDASTVRPGSSSHAYDFAVIDGNVLRFTFNHILLADSNVNEAASHGFLKFHIAQTPNLDNGTRIENSAAIYFDYNEPVITNTTFHTIGDHFITVNTEEADNEGLLNAYPNPASDAVFFQLKDWADVGRFELSNGFGQLVTVERFSGKQFRFERKSLPAGIYLFKILANDTKTASGKIILK